MLLRPSVHPDHRRPGRPAVSRAEMNEDLKLALETLIDYVKRSNPNMHPLSEMAIIVRDAEAVIKRMHWERM